MLHWMRYTLVIHGVVLEFKIIPRWEVKCDDTMRTTSPRLLGSELTDNVEIEQVGASSSHRGLVMTSTGHLPFRPRPL